MTNYEKIKSMSEYEMTRFLYAIDSCKVCDYRSHCRKSPYSLFSDEKYDCEDGIGKWLRGQVDI